MFLNCLVVAFGGAIGAVLRYLSDLVARKYVGDAFPVGTLFVNCLGSFVLGVLVGSQLVTNPKEPRKRLFVGTGILGAFTTFSTFSADTIHHANEGHWVVAGLNVVLNVTIGIGAALAGYYIGRRFAQ